MKCRSEELWHKDWVAVLLLHGALSGLILRNTTVKTHHLCKPEVKGSLVGVWTEEVGLY